MTADHGDNSPSPGRRSTDPAGSSRFDVVVRGYDRRQVDDHIFGLEQTVTRLRAELDQARGGRPSSDAGSLFSPGTGPRRGTSEETTEAPQASGLTPEVISSFTGRLQNILQAAEEEAEEVRTNARNFARAEEESGRTRLAELMRQRESVLSELGRVRSQLDGMLAQSETGAPAANGSQPESPSTGRPGQSRSSGQPAPKPVQPVQSPPTPQSNPRPSPSPRPRPEVTPRPAGPGGGEPGPGRPPARGTVAPQGQAGSGNAGHNGGAKRENSPGPRRGDSDGGRPHFGGNS